MRFAIAMLSLLLVPVSAHAETIDVLVQRPAPANDVYMLRSLSIGRFTGTDGRPFGSALERELADLRDSDGQPLFEMFEAGAGEGSVTGRADVDFVEGRFVESRLLCPNSNNPNAKCDKAVKQEVSLNCRSRVVTLDADVRIARGDNGRIISSRAFPQRNEARWCPGDTNPPEIQSVVTSLIRRSASEAVADFVPFSQLMPIRIREDRKGLSKEVGASFKAAVLATRADGSQGCSMFEALEPVAGTHRSLMFNLSLCAEARSDFEGAIDGYRSVGDREAIAAAERANASQAAIAQARERRGE